MLSRRRCCINAAILIILTFLSALILVWSSSVNSIQQPPHSRQLESSLDMGVDPVSNLSVFITDSMNAGQTFKTQKPVQNESYNLPSISHELLKRFPKVMIIGFGKAGTKALFEALKLHPQLSGPYKERRFFSQHYSIGLENYLRSLPDPPNHGYNSEKSPDYIIVPPSPKRIRLAASIAGVNLHSLKFVVVLRDPIDRAMSEYLEWNILRKSSSKPRLPPFEDMVIDKNGDVDASQPFINASCYAYHIQNWLKHFSNEQMCYVDGDMFVMDPLKELHMLETCLKLEHYFSEKNFVYDQGRGFYCFQDPKSVNKSTCMNKSKGRKHPDIPEHVVKRLRNYFQPWSSRIPELTGRTITWST